jgi:hypothetical protein
MEQATIKVAQATVNAARLTLKAAEATLKAAKAALATPPAHRAAPERDRSAVKKRKERVGGDAGPAKRKKGPPEEILAAKADSDQALSRQLRTARRAKEGAQRAPAPEAEDALCSEDDGEDAMDGDGGGDDDSGSGQSEEDDEHLDPGTPRSDTKAAGEAAAPQDQVKRSFRGVRKASKAKQRSLRALRAASFKWGRRNHR